MEEVDPEVTGVTGDYIRKRAEMFMPFAGCKHLEAPWRRVGSGCVVSLTVYPLLG